MNMNNNHDVPHGGFTPANDEPNILASGMGAPPVSHGWETARILPDDDHDAEYLTEQGMDHAEEDLMRQAQRAQRHKDW